MRLERWCFFGVLTLTGACTQSGRSFLGSDGDTSGGDTTGDTSPGDTTGEDTTPDTDTAEDTATDTAGDTATDTDTTSSLGCAVAEQLFMPYCERCHNQGDNYPDLGAGAMSHLVNADALAYPGEKLVVPGNLGASFLYKKVHGPSADDGAIMPPPEEDAAPAEGIAALEAWINGGAPPCEGWDDPGPMTQAPTVPGGAITFNAAPSGFQTTQPSWSEDGTCSAQQWWKYQGETESSSMHPGQDCVGCHQRERGPSLSFGGTVYPSLDEASDCRGVSGVKVELLDVDDVTFATTTTNTAGNFYFRSRDKAFKPYRVRLTYQGREREMQLIQSQSGDCNTCHDSSGNKGTLGRVVAP